MFSLVSCVYSHFPFKKDIRAFVPSFGQKFYLELEISHPYTLAGSRRDCRVHLTLTATLWVSFKRKLHSSQKEHFKRKNATYSRWRSTCSLSQQKQKQPTFLLPASKLSMISAKLALCCVLTSYNIFKWIFSGFPVSPQISFLSMFSFFLLSGDLLSKAMMARATLLSAFTWEYAPIDCSGT